MSAPQSTVKWHADPRWASNRTIVSTIWKEEYILWSFQRHVQRGDFCAHFGRRNTYTVYVIQYSSIISMARNGELSSISPVFEQRALWTEKSTFRGTTRSSAPGYISRDADYNNIYMDMARGKISSYRTGDGFPSDLLLSYVYGRKTFYWNI